MNFTEINYNNKSGIQSCIFGPPLWFVLHCISFTYPVNPTEDEKTNYMNFVASLEHVLPCTTCRDNYKGNLKVSNFNMSVMKNRDTFSRFMYNLHNCVNKCLGKKVNPTFEEIRDKFENFRSRCLNPSANTDEQSSQKEKTPKKEKKEKEKKKEKGCIDSMYGVKSRTIVSIVPACSKKINFKVDPKCKATRI